MEVMVPCLGSVGVLPLHRINCSQQRMVRLSRAQYFFFFGGGVCVVLVCV